jgi:PAS domain S-box-containing protein
VPDKEFLLAFAGITANAMIRKKAEENLIRSEQRMKAYLDYSPDGIFITDYDGIILDVNQAGADFIGFPGNNLIGTNVNKLIVELQMPEIDRLIDDLTEDGHNFKVRVNYRKSDNTISTALLSCVRINKNLYASFVKNIDDIISAEEILINAKLKAEESDRLKSAFLANMSHEIRSPMNGILGFANLLRRKDLSEEKKKQFIDIINNNGNQLLVLIDDLLDIAKIEANQLKIEPRNCNLASIINEIYLQYKPKADEKKINFIIHSQQDEHEFDIYSDCYRIKQIITNLVTNALKFTAKGRIQIFYKVENEKITIEVSDTGIGIDKSNLEKIFNRFEQIENSHLSLSSGTGLGLAITKGLVKLLYGTIKVDSQSDEGSTFTVCLPAFAEHHTRDSKQHQISEQIIPQNIDQTKTILICEDEEANYLYLAEIMHLNKFKHIRAENGREAVKAIKENPDICLVLMDLKMPLMDGHEASKIIKSIRPKIPIIAQTAYVLEQPGKNLIGSSFNDCITKPAAPEEIISKIHLNLKNF